MNTELKEKMLDAAAECSLEETYEPMQKDAIKFFKKGAEYMYAELAPLLEWVSVEDRLPEEKGRYLIKSISGYIVIAYFNGEYIEDLDSTRYKEAKFWRKIEL